MDISSNQYEGKYEGMTLDYGPSTPDSPNTGQLSDINIETETKEKLLEEYYEAKIDQNYVNLHLIRKTVEEERIYLRASINLFNKSKIPFSLTVDMFIAKVAGS